MSVAMWLRRLLLFAALLLSQSAMAGTEVVEVYYLPLDEAVSVVQSQLSPQGSVHTLSSRRLLVISDDEPYLSNAKKLLRQLDQPPAQYRVEVELVEMRDTQGSGLAVQSLQLPGGWVEVRLDRSRSRIVERRRMQLRVTSMQPGHIEAGELRPYRQRIRQWLAGYGVVSVDSVQLEPVTSGFDIRVMRAGAEAVRVQLSPWMRRMAMQGAGQSRTRIDLGKGRVQMRQQPTPAADAPIIIAGAQTELTVRLGETVTVAANGGESALFSQALLGGQSTTISNHLAIRLRVVAVGLR